MYVERASLRAVRCSGTPLCYQVGRLSYEAGGRCETEAMAPDGRAENVGRLWQVKSLLLRSIETTSKACVGGCAMVERGCMIFCIVRETIMFFGLFVLREL